MLNTMLRRFVLATVVAGGALSIDPSPASAWLKICNQTNKTVSYHHSRYSSACGSDCGDPWVKEGWWTMTPGQCKTVYSGSAKDKWFYYYAESTDGTLFWTSDSWRWDVPSTSHTLCHCIGCAPACFPEYNHREKQATHTDSTWILRL